MMQIRERKKHNSGNMVSWCVLVSILLWVLMTVTTGLVHAEIPIPKQSDWTDQGLTITEGPSGSWDVRLDGMISPCTVVKKDGTYFLYYIGADGDSSTDGGPRHRALGVATSTNGITFTKYSGNPILTHLPHNNDEEGIFSGGATRDAKNGDIILYYAALDAGSATSDSVSGDIRLAVSSDGFNFTEIGDVISHSDSSVWGYGDELFPVGTFQANGQWYVYYIAKGYGAYWDLGLAWGPSADDLPNTQAVLTSGSYIIGGCDPVCVAPDKIALFVLTDFSTRIVEVRTVLTDTPGTLSAPVETYDFSDSNHMTIFLDSDISTWFMYYKASGAIRVKTAPVVSTGTISGTVTNTIGAPIQGATVTDGTRSATTDETGGYTRANVPEGTYTVTCTMGGYQDASHSGVVVHEGETTTVNFVLQDNISPYTSGHSPAKDATGASRNTSIAVHIKDDGAGVDKSSILMTVEGSTITPVVTGTPADYTLTYDPPNDFDYDQVVDITIDAHDLASIANVMHQDIYSFTIESAPDTIPPAVVTDLAASDPTSYSIAVTWTAPGDDENTGTASQYDIRYSSTEISEANWNAATQCTGEPTPQIAGSTERFTVTGLSSTTTYYFALKAADEVPKWAGISNCASGTTLEESDLVGEWHLDEGTGLTAGDTSGNGNDGTLVNNPAWVNGKIGKALSFDGTDDYVDCGQSSSLKITGAITVIAWVKWHGASNPYFVTKTGGPGRRSYDLSGNDDSTVEFRVGGADCNTVIASGTISIPAGEWVYLAGTYEPSSHVRLFVDGSLVRENTVSIPASQGDNGLPWYIGAREGNQGWFNGIIDEVKIYNRALSPDEVQADYEAGASNLLPTAFIDSITPSAAEQGKDTVSFTGHGTDIDGSVVACNWRSSIDGQLSTASSFSKPASELSEGTHTIYFKVQDNDGAWSAEVTDDLAILEPANQAPVADPSGPYTGTEGVAIAYDGSGSYDYDGSIVTYEWDFGDGNNATGVTPTHTYAHNGTYTVILTVTDNDGASNTSTTTATIADTEPTADFSVSPTSGPEPLAVTFSDRSTSYDGIIAWDWDFDSDGIADSTEQNPTHEYAEDGIYTVSLTVYENDGDSDSMTKVDYISVTKVNNDLVAEWHLDDGNGPTAVDTSGNGNDGTIYGAGWTDGKLGKGLCFDGTEDYIDCGQSSSLKITGAITVEAWVKWQGASNPYFVTKTGGPGRRSYDLSGNEDGTVEFRVGGADCNTVISSGTISIPAGEWVYLAGTYEPSSYVRLFVDGSLVRENTVSIPASQGDNGLPWYIGAREGNQGWFNGIIDEVKIYNRALSPDEVQADYEAGASNLLPTALIDSITPDPAEQGKDTVAFTGHGTDIDGSVVAYNWRSSIEGQLSTASSFTKPASELSVGTHTIYFKVQDDDGAWSTEVREDLAILEPANQAPVADPNGPYTGTEGVAIAYDGTGSYDPDGSIVAYEWDFGDGNTATGATPTHIYAQNGTYTVILTGTDNDGATNTSTTTATIADTEPTADFSASPTSGPEPLTVTFSDRSTSYDGIIAWDWDFNSDGIADSRAQNPTHEYAEEGVYTVILTVYESDGDSDSMTKVDYISVTKVNNAPYAPANPSPSDGETDVQIDAVFSWTGSDPDAEDTVTYDVYFGTSMSPPLVAENQPENTYDPGTLDYSTEYYWQVVVKDNHGAATKSVVWSFTTASAPGSDLVAEWHLDDGNGPTAVDTSGNGNDGTIYGAGWIDGKLGKALSFDGTEDYIDCGQSSSLKITGAITVEAWVKWQGASNPYFVTKTGGPGHRSFHLSGNEDGTVEFRVGGADGNTVKSSGTISIPADEWVHLTGTYEPSSYVRLFVDGSLAKENTAAIPASQGDNGLPWYIGAREGNQGWFNGVIDEVKIYNRALSPDEVQAEYEAGASNLLPTAFVDLITPDPAEQGKDTVAFTGHGTDTDGSVVAYNWSSSIDGLLSTASSFTKPASELSVGTHTIYFKVQDDDGAWSTEVREDLAILEPANQAPVADPNGPYTDTEGVAIAYDGSDSYDPDGSIVAYEWDFGDGNTATGATPAHIYAQNGTYTVILTVTDNDGEINTSTTTATIADTEPTANFSASPTSGPEPLTVTFSDRSTSYDGIIAWDWDFDSDGIADSSVQNPTHEYAEEGVYTVILTVYESDGDSDSMTKVDYISVTKVNNAPYAPANPSPSDGATDVPIEAVLSWTGGDPDAEDTVTYDVYFGTSISSPLVAENQPGTTYDPGMLDYSTGYYWQIVAKDDHGAMTEGEVWSFTTTAAAPDTPPIVSNPSATPDTILNDNGRPRIPGTNISQLTVTVTDDTGVDTVTIDLSPIGGSDEAQMNNIPGTDIWTITTNAVDGINHTHDLIVTATNSASNLSTSTSIQLTVLRRGDVNRDNDVDAEDALAIQEYLEGEGHAPSPGVFIGDVYPATGDNAVDLLDVEYIFVYAIGYFDEP